MRKISIDEECRPSSGVAWGGALPQLHHLKVLLEKIKYL